MLAFRYSDHLLLHRTISWYIISIDHFTHMNRPTLPKRMINGAPSLGDKVAFTRTLTEADVALFIGTTWDVNPLHTDEIYCSGYPVRAPHRTGLAHRQPAHSPGWTVGFPGDGDGFQVHRAGLRG